LTVRRGGDRPPGPLIDAAWAGRWSTIRVPTGEHGPRRCCRVAVAVPASGKAYHRAFSRRVNVGFSADETPSSLLFKSVSWFVRRGQRSDGHFPTQPPWWSSRQMLGVQSALTLSDDLPRDRRAATSTPNPDERHRRPGPGLRRPTCTKVVATPTRRRPLFSRLRKQPPWANVLGTLHGERPKYRLHLWEEVWAKSTSRSASEPLSARKIYDNEKGSVYEWCCEGGRAARSVSPGGECAAPKDLKNPATAAVGPAASIGRNGLYDGCDRGRPPCPSGPFAAKLVVPNVDSSTFAGRTILSREDRYRYPQPQANGVKASLFSFMTCAATNSCSTGWRNCRRWNPSARRVLRLITAVETAVRGRPRAGGGNWPCRSGLGRLSTTTQGWRRRRLSTRHDDHRVGDMALLQHGLHSLAELRR